MNYGDLFCETARYFFFFLVQRLVLERPEAKKKKEKKYIAVSDNLTTTLSE